jgi:alkanesulfonate monooxygenase SsuD/methylene tetrahydromethanopterin reductase-like flavin-dependent oxidoreductase (luciferase family)
MARYEDTRQVMMLALTQKSVSFRGQFFSFDNVPMELEPFHKPHPPIWIGAARTDSAARAARNGHNFVSLSSAAETRALTDSYRTAWTEAHGDKPLPKLGLGRFIVVGESDAAALALARRAYLKWHDSFHHLWRKHGTVPTQGERARVRRDHGWWTWCRGHARNLHSDATIATVRVGGQLFGRTVCVRRHEPCGSTWFDRPVCARGDAGRAAIVLMKGAPALR